MVSLSTAIATFLCLTAVLMVLVKRYRQHEEKMLTAEIRPPVASGIILKGLALLFLVYIVVLGQLVVGYAAFGIGVQQWFD